MIERFPPLYECSKCGAPVEVKSLGEGVEPQKIFSCDHTDAIIWANRKVTLRGKGGMTLRYRFTLKLRQFLSMILGRSV